MCFENLRGTSRFEAKTHNRQVGAQLRSLSTYFLLDLRLWPTTLSTIIKFHLKFHIFGGVFFKSTQKLGRMIIKLFAFNVCNVTALQSINISQRGSGQYRFKPAESLLHIWTLWDATPVHKFGEVHCFYGKVKCFTILYWFCELTRVWCFICIYWLLSLKLRAKCLRFSYWQDSVTVLSVDCRTKIYRKCLTFKRFQKSNQQ